MNTPGAWPIRIELIDMKDCSKGALVAVAAVAALAGCSAAADNEGWTTDGTAIEQAVDSCNVKKSGWVTVGDEGSTLVIDGADDTGFGGLATDKTVCLLGEVGISDATAARMSTTSSLMGQQEATDGEFDVLWSYHPDNGLDIVVTETSGDFS